MIMKLKPSTEYRYSDKDMLFIQELMKVGYVRILSQQVVLIDEKVGRNESHNFLFKDYGNGNNKVDGLTLPDNWCIESITSNDNQCRITFGVKS